MREFLLSSAAQVLPANADPDALRLLTDNTSWVVRAADGRYYLKWRAVAYLLRQNPLVAVFGWLTDFSAVRPTMRNFYDVIGNHRRFLGSITSRIFPIRSEPSIGAFGEIFCATLMWLTVICNVMSFPWPWKTEALAATKLAARSQVFEALQIGQSWSLFAPNPTNYQRRYIVWAYDAGGKRFDLMRQIEHPLFWLNGGYGVTFLTHRWLKYFTHLGELTPLQQEAAGRYFCDLPLRDPKSLNSTVRVELLEFIEPANRPWNEETAPAFRITQTCERAA
jgi:hypothetical protein